MSSSFLPAKETRTLEALCLALLPSLAPSDGSADEGGLMARSASDLDVAGLVVGVVAAEPAETRAIIEPPTTRAVRRPARRT